MPSSPLLGGRYELHAEIGSGGMATVHLARQRGGAGFSRVVAIKAMHPHLAKDADFVAMFLDEARVASRIRHPNVVSITDVIASEGSIFLVMDYIGGIALHRLGSAEGSRRLPVPVALRIVHDTLLGLSAAHDAKGERGEPLGVVHRDVSPQNLLVGDDGVTRLLDFGIAKAEGRLQERTRTSHTKGKIAYMAPEQLFGEAVDARADIHAAGVCMWELLAGRRAFVGSEPELMRRVVEDALVAPSSIRSEVPWTVDEIVARATQKDASQRYSTAAEMAAALEASGVPLAEHAEVRRWLLEQVGPLLAERAELVRGIEQGTDVDATPGDAFRAGAGAEVVPREATPASARAAVADPKARGRGIWVTIAVVVAAALSVVAVLRLSTAERAAPISPESSGEPQATVVAAPLSSPAGTALPDTEPAVVPEPGDAPLQPSSEPSQAPTHRAPPARRSAPKTTSSPGPRRETLY